MFNSQQLKKKKEEIKAFFFFLYVNLFTIVTKMCFEVVCENGVTASEGIQVSLCEFDKNQG